MFPENVILFTGGTSLGGAELFQLEILKELKAEGVKVYLVDACKGSLSSRYQEVTESQLFLSFPYPRKPISWIHYFAFKKKVSDFVCKIKGSKVLLVGDFYELWAVTKLNRSLRLPVYSLWQGEYEFDNYSCASKWLRYGALSADKLIASEPIVGHLKNGNVGLQCVEVLNPKIDNIRFNPERYSRSEIRRSLGLKDSDRVAICVGQIGEGKGQPWLVHEFLSRPELYERWKLIVAGPVHKKERDKWEDLIVRDYAKKVLYLGSRNDIPELYAASDLALFPGTANESYGMALLEACLMDLPVLAFKVGAIPFNVVGEYSGLISVGDKSKLLEQWAESVTETLHMLQAELVPTKERLKLRDGLWSTQIKNIFSLSR